MANNIAEITDNLCNFYSFLNTYYKEKKYDYIVNKIFNTELLKKEMNNCFENVCIEYFLNNKFDIVPFKIQSFDNCYLFLNYLLKINFIDLEIYYNHKIILEYIVSIINLLNKILTKWVTLKSVGFRKGSKLFFQLNKSETINLYFYPFIKIEK